MEGSPSVPFLSIIIVLGFIWWLVSKRGRFGQFHSRTVGPRAHWAPTSARQAPTTASVSKRYYTPAEIAKHCQRDSLWLIIDGKVYDVTSYVDQHPGGSAIFRNGGADSSVGFHGDQHPDKVNDLLPDFYIGELDDSEKIAL